MTPFSAREMMFGLRTVFEYVECEDCGSVQIQDVPSDLGSYYRKYWSEIGSSSVAPAWKRAVRSALLHVLLTAPVRFCLATTYSARRPDSRLARAYRYRIRPGDRVLDVGCGAGGQISMLADLGFKNPIGIDPFVESDVDFANGARVKKGFLDSLGPDETFDFIMFHHSLEHVPSPIDTLRLAARHLRSGGRCMVRIPTTSSCAFRTYRENWVQLDPPRHIFVPSREGMRLVGEAAGLKSEGHEDDSTAFQFWGSEQYRRDIPLRTDERLPKASQVFTPDEIVDFEAKTKVVNAASDGDQSMFFFRKP